MTKQEVPSWVTLTPNEEVLLDTGPRPQLIGLGLLLGVGSILVVLGFKLPLGLTLVGILPPILIGFWVHHTQYLITTEGLYRKTGILIREVRSVNFHTIQDISYSQSILGTVFDHGTITVTTAGSHGLELVFWFVNEPQLFEQRIRGTQSQHKKSREQSIPGRKSQWRRVLNEVKALRKAFEQTG